MRRLDYTPEVVALLRSAASHADVARQIGCTAQWVRALRQRPQYARQGGVTATEAYAALARLLDRAGECRRLFREAGMVPPNLARLFATGGLPVDD